MRKIHGAQVIFGAVMAMIFSCNGELTSLSASEGGCINPPTETRPEAFSFMLTNFNWNIPMASQLYYRKFAEVLLGRSAEDEDELARMNLTAISTAAGTKASGYDVFVTQMCVPTRYNFSNPAIITEYSCPSTPVSSAPGWKKLSGVLLSGVPAPKVSLLYTDLVNTLVMSECIDGAHRAFVIMSLNKTLTFEQDAKIREVVQNAGYDLNKIQYL